MVVVMDQKGWFVALLIDTNKREDFIFQI